MAEVSALAGLRRKLECDGFDLSSRPGMIFQARATGVVATAYHSGKILVQGRETSSFVQRYLIKDSTEPSGGAPETRGSIGSDESGKGDWFGPLVVAAAFLPPGRCGEVRGLGVTDSKRMTDGSVRAAAPRLRGIVEHRTLCWNPAEYNLRYDQERNLNRLLAAAHAEVLVPLLRAHPESPALVDRFGKEELVERELAAAGFARGRVRQLPRAESDPAVAAASVLARERFLIELAALSKRERCVLPKGAGQAVEHAGRRVHAMGGMEGLRRVAKLHFATTARVVPVWGSDT